MSATMTSAVRAATPVIVPASTTPASPVGPSLFLDRLTKPVDVLVQTVRMGEDRADYEHVMGHKSALQHLLERAGS
jgi:hypothetical protein